ncbi:MAG: histidinol dehydrogenase, partial [Methanobacterium sp.]
MEIVRLGSIENEKLLERSKTDVKDIIEVVNEVINNVKENGDTSLKFYTEKFDDVKLETLRVSPRDIKRSYDNVDKNVVEALQKAAGNIEKFHKAQLPKEWFMEVDIGIKAGQIIRPVENVGCYIPGGRAVYPSSVLMTIIPA